MTERGDHHPGRGLSAEVLLWGAIGLFMGAIGPFGTDAVRSVPRFTYWLICMVGGGLIGIIVDRLCQGRIKQADRRTVLVAVTMTPAVTLLVMAVGHLLIRQPFDLVAYARLLWSVLIVSLAAMTVRALIWRRARLVIETRTLIAAPLPEAEAVFRRRLSARRRTADLIAVEAHDHYLRVHTGAGTELVTMRFTDALGELEQAHGYRVHRSWWVAAPAIDKVRWHRGGGEMTLVGDLTVPVSRSYKSMLTTAGWY